MILKDLEELQSYLASKIKKARLSQNMTQKELAEKSNIPLATYRRLEQKEAGSIRDFIKILISFDSFINNSLEISPFYLPLNNRVYSGMEFMAFEMIPSVFFMTHCQIVLGHL